MDDSSRAKLGKRVLQKAEAVLEARNAPISSHCLKIWDWTHIFLILVTSLILDFLLNFRLSIESF